MDRPVTHTQASTLPIRPALAKPPSRRIGLAFLSGPVGHERYALAYLKGNSWPRIGRAAKMTGLSAKTLVRCARLGWIPPQGIKTQGGARARYFHLQTLYQSRIFTFEKAARYFGLNYEQVRWHYRSFMQRESLYARRQKKSHTYRISVFDLCRVLNRETWPSKEHLRLVEHDTVRGGRNLPHPATAGDSR